MNVLLDGICERAGQSGAIQVRGAAGVGAFFESGGGADPVECRFRFAIEKVKQRRNALFAGGGSCPERLCRLGKAHFLDSLGRERI